MVRGETTLFGMKVFLVSAVLLMAARAAVAEDALVDPRGWSIHRELLPHSQDRSKVIELFWTKPEGKGPFPGHRQVGRAPSSCRLLDREGRNGSLDGRRPA
jgi:hypothetical protein